MVTKVLLLVEVRVQSSNAADIQVQFTVGGLNVFF